MKLLPQEIEVWYLIPGIRRELSNIFLDKHNLNQKEISKILGLTESAVSQYIKNKRGNELKFSSSDKKIIENYAKKILKDRENSAKHLYNLTKKLRGNESLCEIHKKNDPTIEKDCKICMG